MTRLNGNKLRAAAPQLYHAARQAFSFLVRDEAVGVDERQAVLDKLAAAIDLAERGSDDGSAFKFAVTPPSAEALYKIMDEIKAPDELDARLVLAMREGARATKKRVYFSLPIDREVLERFRKVIDSVSTYDYRLSKMLDRLKSEVDQELTKSPLSYLASAGL